MKEGMFDSAEDGRKFYATGPKDMKIGKKLDSLMDAPKEEVEEDYGSHSGSRSS